MSRPNEEPKNKDLRIEIRPLDIATATAELQRRLPETQAAVQRLEETKIVSQEDMKLEMTI